MIDNLVLQLADLSLAGAKVTGSIAPIEQIGGGLLLQPDCLSFPDLGIKVAFGGRDGSKIISYIFLFPQDETRDWLHRLNGVDHFGATFRAYSGRIWLGTTDCTVEFLRNPVEFMRACSSFRFYHDKPRLKSFILLGAKGEPRLHLEFGASGDLMRLVLG